MSKNKHTEAEMITALKQVQAGRTADDVGVSEHTIYGQPQEGAARISRSGTESATQPA